MNLQLALIAIGIVVVAAIYFYSRWEAPRNRHKRQRSAIKPPAEPSFGREEPSLVTDLDADYQGYVDDDSSFSTDSYLDADSAVESDIHKGVDKIEDETKDEVTGEVDDAGIMEARYSKSVELKLSGAAAEEEEATDYQDRLDGDILSTDIPVLDARVDTEGEVSDEQEALGSDATPSWQDDETESAFETGGYNESSDAASVQSDDHMDGGSKQEPPVETENLLEGVERDDSYRGEQEPESELKPEPEPAPAPEPEPEQQLEPEPEPEFESYEADAEERIEMPAQEQNADSYQELREYNETTDVESVEEYSQSGAERWDEDSEDAVSHAADSGAAAPGAAAPGAAAPGAAAPDLVTQEGLQEKPTLKRFLGSIKQIHKIKDTIQHKLDAVKAEREKTWDESDEVEAEDPEAPPAMVQEQRGLFDDDALTGPPQSITERESAPQDKTRRAPSLGDAEPINEPKSERDLKSELAQESNNGVSINAAEGFEKLSQIDYYVKLSGDRDVSRDSVLAIYREGASDLSKTHSIYGLRMPDKVWRDLENEPEESRFGDLVITIQLADQNGPVTEQDMTRFSGLVMKLSESTGRGFAFMAPIESAHEQAQAIEKFRKRFDSIFVVNIRPLEEETFDGAMIERCATQIGLTPDENNFYARYKPVGKQKVCLYSLANMSDTGEFDMDNLRGLKTRGVTFFTRPAVNRSPGAVFSEMVDAAKAFASRIKGEAIAPGYDDLSMEDVEAIRKSIEKVAREMESYGIIPGSEEATRLF